MYNNGWEIEKMFCEEKAAMRTFPKLLTVLILLAMTLACRMTAAPQSEVSEQDTRATIQVMQATIDAMGKDANVTAEAWLTESAGQPGDSAGGAGTPVPYGSISGSLSFPSEFIPAQRLVAFNTTSDAFIALELEAGSMAYMMDNVPPGQYTLVAYVMDDSDAAALTGGYTRAVPCGLLASCTDHSLITFEVRAGEETSQINPADWYALAGSFPPDPTR